MITDPLYLGVIDPFTLIYSFTASILIFAVLFVVWLIIRLRQSDLRSEMVERALQEIEERNTRLSSRRAWEQTMHKMVFDKDKESMT